MSVPVRSRALLLCLLLPTLAWAQASGPPIAGPVGLDGTTEDEVVPIPGLRIGVSFTGLAATLSMQDMNGIIDDLTPIARTEWGAPEIRLKQITSGVGYGLGLSTLINDRWLVLVDYERLTGQSKVGGRKGRADIQLPVKSIGGTIGYAISANGQVHFGFGAGLSRYESDGTADFIVDDDLVERLSFKGNTIGQHYVSWVDAPVLGRFRLLFLLGYRSAKIQDFEVVVELPEAPPVVEGEEPVAPELLFPVAGEGNSLDWSGLLTRASLVYSFSF